ncbi:hypothetical protein HBA55_16815 [Pseudomaricurvus alkylphenolicus]|nr:hypothetical protein [Pseudomaricurvus alkylphenolicus]
MTLAALLSLVFGAGVVAETIRIPIGQQGSQQTIEKPALGMSMAEVRAAFGEPVEQREPRGEPPISRWEYERFVVYFESDIVIHSVIKHVRRDVGETKNP